MYSKKFLYNSVFYTPFTRPNLNVKNACSDQYLVKYFCTFQHMTEISNEMNSIITKVKIIYKNSNIHEVLSKRFNFIPTKLKDQSTIIIRAWTRQCEYIVAQRFRRTQQMFCLYNRMWEERALRDLLAKMRQQVTRKSKEFVFGAVGISAFNWEMNKISDDDISKHMTEFDYVNLLKEKTITCKNCNQRRLVDIMLPDMNYCKCSNNSDGYILDEWIPFLERKDLIVWRRQRSKGVYEYKLYGVYDDVTAEDFLLVQVDTEYRQHWDTTAVSLYVIDSDQKSNSDIIYWEMLWPRMFANRDYVFNRRYKVDTEKKVIAVVSKSVEHPDFPRKLDKHRVTDYESCMVIRPSNEMNQPGIEFSLTYYDDPGVNIPAAVTSWVAIAGMPDFLMKLRNAAKEYRKNKEEHFNIPLDTSKENKETSPPKELVDPPVHSMPSSTEEEPQHLSMTPENESSGYWRYFHPYYYLG